LISQYVGQFKENIRVKRFARYKVGEEWKKRKSQDLREYY
jgi:translation elongation factor EF-Ts